VCSTEAKEVLSVFNNAKTWRLEDLKTDMITGKVGRLLKYIEMGKEYISFYEIISEFIEKKYYCI